MATEQQEKDQATNVDRSMDVLNQFRGTPAATVVAEEKKPDQSAANQPAGQAGSPQQQPTAKADGSSKPDWRDHRLKVQSVKIARLAAQLAALEKSGTAPAVQPAAGAPATAPVAGSDEGDGQQATELFDFLKEGTDVTAEEEHEAEAAEAVPPANDDKEFIDGLRQEKADEQFAMLVEHKRATKYPNLTDEAIKQAIAQMMLKEKTWDKLDLYLAAAERDILSSRIDRTAGDVGNVSANGAPPAVPESTDRDERIYSSLENWRAGNPTRASKPE